MSRSTLMRQAAGRYERPLSEVVRETLEREGTLDATAVALQISAPTLRAWIRQWGLTPTLTLRPTTPEEPGHAPESLEFQKSLVP